jgi:hypothetical protein
MSFLSRLLALTALCLLVSSIHSQASTFTWTGAVSSDWLNTANWSPTGVPGQSDSASITNGSPTITNAVSVGTVNLGGGTLTAGTNGGLSVVTAFIWTNGVIHGQLTIGSSATMTLSNVSGTLDMPDTSLVNNGSAVWSAGEIRGDSGLVISNNGTWLAQSENQINNAYGGTPNFYNNGLFESASTNTTQLSGVAFNNSGSVEVQSGVIIFGGGGSFAGTLVATNQTQVNLSQGGYLNGTFTASTNANINLEGGTFTYGPSLILRGPGTNALTQAGVLTLTNTVIPNLSLTGGTVMLGPAFQNGGAITNLTLNGSLLSGTNTLTGTMNWLAGQINGVFTVASSGVLNLSGSANVFQNAALTNSGQIIWNGSGNWYLENGSVGGILNNLSGGVIAVQCNAAINPSGNVYFINSGTVIKSLSSGTTVVAVSFTNNGTVTLESGTMDFNAGGSFGGSFVAGNGTAFYFYEGGLLSGSFTAGYGASNNFSQGTFTQTPTLSFAGAGVSQLSGGTLTLLQTVPPNFQVNQGTVNLASGFEGGTITNLTFNESNSGITLAGANTVTGTLNLNASTSGPLIIEAGAVLNWSGGTIGGPLTIASNATLNITGTTVYVNASLTNLGTINWNGAYLDLDYEGTIYNEPGAIFDINCDQTFGVYYGTESFINAGLVEKTAGVGTTVFYPVLTNTGTMSVQSGTLELDAYETNSYLGGFFLAEAGTVLEFNGGGYLAGTYTAAPEATVELSDGPFTYSPTAALFNGAGTNLLTSTGVLTLISNTLPNLQLVGGTVIPGPFFQAGTITNLTLYGSSLGGANSVTGTLTMVGAANTSAEIAGPLIVASNATFNILQTLYVEAGLTNAGTINWSNGTITVYVDGAIYNLPGAVFNVECNENLYAQYYYDEGIFYNAGLLLKSASTGTTYVEGYLTNTGVVEVESGILQLAGPVENPGGTFQADAGGELNLSDGGSLTANYYAAAGGSIVLSAGAFTNTTTTSFGGPGLYVMTGGTDALLYGLITNLVYQGGAIIPGPLFQGGSITNLALTNAVGLEGSNFVTGVLTINGNGNIMGPVTLGAGSILNLTGSVEAPITVAGGATATINGTIDSTLTLSPGAIVTVAGGYVEYGLAVPTNATLNLAGPGQVDFVAPLTNAGIVNWSGGNLYMYYESAIYNQAGASFNILSNGTISVEEASGPGAPFFLNAGLVRKSLATGTSQINTLFTNDAVLDVESGTIFFDNTFSQIDGTWDIGIDGLASNGQLDFSGVAPLSGSLNVHLNDNYVLGLSNSFTLLTYTSTTGSFATVSLPTNGASWQLNYGSSVLTLNLTNLNAPVVSLTGPANNAAFVIPASIPITASVVDAKSAITGVQFYQGTNLLGQGASSGGNSFSFSWTSAAPGLYALSALATDANGAVGTSAPVNIVVYSNHNPTTNFTWIGTVSSDWFNPTNWTPTGVPGALDNAAIAGGAAVALSQNTSVNNVNFSAGTLQGAGVLTVTNVFNWSGGTLGGSIAIPAGGTLNINGSNTLNFPGASLVNMGTVLWSAGALSGDGSAITNNGLWLVQSDTSINSGTFINNGIIRKTIASNTSQFYYQTFVNNGTIDAESGTISLQSGGALSGTYNAGLGAFVTLASGAFTMSNVPAFTGSGSNEFTGGSLTLLADASPALQLIGGNLILGPAFQNNGAISNLAVSGSSLNGTNTVSGRLNFSGGTLDGPLTISAAGLLNIGSTNGQTPTYANGVPIVNFGQVNWLGSYFSDEGGAITNNGLWVAEAVGQVSSELPLATFVNNGTIQKTGSGASEIYSASFSNNGTIDIQAGILELGGGGVLSGTYNAAAGASLYFVSGAYTLGSLPNFTGPGSFLLNGGSLTVESDIPPNLELYQGTVILGSHFQNGGSINSLTLADVTLSGNYTVSGSVTLNGTTVTGSLTVESGGTLNVVSNGFTLNAGTLTNFGTVLWSGGTIDAGNSSFIVNNGLWLAQSAVSLELYQYSGAVTSFLNNGIFRVQAPDVYLVGLFDNAGLIDVENGYLYFDSGGAVSGTYNTAAQGFVYFNEGAFTNSSPATFTGTGTNIFTGYSLLLLSDQLPNVSLQGGTVSVGPLFQNKGAITNLTLNGTTLAGTNAVSGTLNWLNGDLQGVLTILTNGLLNISGAATKTFDNATMVNFGTVLWTGGELVGNQTNAITNNGQWLVQSDQTLTTGYYLYTNFTFVNAGNFSKTGTSGTTSIDYLSFLNSGVLDIESGSVQFQANSAYVQTGASLTFGASAPNLAGQLILATNVGLDGTLTLNALNGYVPAFGDSFTPIIYTSESGTFANVNLPSLSAGQTWSIEYGAGGLHLSVTSSNLVAQVPTPSQLSGTVTDTSGHAVAGVTVYATISAVTNLIQNGSFEVPLIGAPYYSYDIFQPGSTNLTGWTIVGPTNTDVATANADYGPPEDGNQFFDPTGNTGGGGITQTFPTTVGASYQLIFYHGTYSHYGYNPALGVTLGASNYTYGETSGNSANLDWTQVVIPFTASSNFTTVGFFDLTGVDANDNFVDNVQVVPAGNGTIFETTTASGGGYQMTLPNGVYEVGVTGLPAAGYNPVPSQSPVTLSNDTQTVNFTPSAGGVTYAIDTAANPPGAGTITASQTVPAGTVVTLTAVANTSALPYLFSNWTENGVVESTASTYTFTAVRNRSLVANFVLPGFLVAVSNNPPSAGVVNGTGVYSLGATCVLTTYPFYGYAFVSWTEGTTVISTGNPLTTTISSNLSLVANYTAANPIHLVTTATSPNGVATIAGAGTYTNGQTIVFTAPTLTTNSGTLYFFQEFTSGTNVVSTSATFTKTFSTVDPPDIQYVAVYVALPLLPQLIGVRDNYPNPVPATTDFILTLQFDRSMSTTAPPDIRMTNAAPGAVQPTVGNNGQWLTTTVSNDTYQSPPVTFSSGMDGTVQVFVSGAQDLLGHVLPSTLATNLVVNTKAQLPPAVSISTPANGATFTAPAGFTFAAAATSANGTIQSVEFLTNGVLLGTAAQTSSPYSVAVSGLAEGSYALSVVATDNLNLSSTSAVVHITVSNPGQTLIDFEAVDASQGPVGGSVLAGYLAGYGVGVSNVTASTSVVVANDQNFGGGNVTRSSSGENFLTQVGANGAVSYTLVFSQPYASVSWIRTLLLAEATGVSAPAWRAHAFDASGNELAAVGESQFVSFTNIPAAPFTLLGPGIASITFDANNNGVSQLSSPPVDDLLLSTLPTNTSLTISLSSGNGSSFSAPAQVSLVAQVGDSLATPTGISFYEGQNLLGTIAPGGTGSFAFAVNNLAAGTYTFTAAATDSAGAARTSNPLTVTIQNTAGISVINFDAAEATANLSNYLAGFGVALTNVTVGSRMEAVSGSDLSVTATAVPSSPPNLLTQVGDNQPVSFTFSFATPLQSVGFTRVALLAGAGGISHPQWTATAFNASGTALGSASEGQILSPTNVPARTFQLVDSGITSVRFNSDSQRLTAFAAVLLDDLVLNTNLIASPPLQVSLTSPAAGDTNFTAPATVNLGASVVDTLSSNYTVSFYSGTALIGSASNSPYTFAWTNVPEGSYYLQAEVIDPSGLATFSTAVGITVFRGGNSATVNFDALDASAGPVTGTFLSNYLAAEGISINAVSPGTALAVENQALINNGTSVAASSPPNILTQIGSNGPVSFTLQFAPVLGQFSFTRPELLANPFVSHPAWTATAYDGSGAVLSTAGAGLISSYTDVPSQIYTLTGPGIATIEFDSLGSGLTTFNALLMDDFLLTTNAITPPTVSIFNPTSSEFFVVPATIEIDALASGADGIAQVGFYANNNLIGAVSTPSAGSQFSILWSNAAVGAYSLTAVATENNGLSQTSAPVNVSLIPSPYVFAISQQPAGQTVAAGSVAFFNVILTGTGTSAVSYQWFLNGAVVAGQTNATLTVFPVQNINAGTYTVQITGGSETLTSSGALLTVAQPPTFSVLPQPTNVNIGGMISLSGAASGTGPFSYQWLLNGTPITGATNNTYVVQNAQPRDSGSYQLAIQGAVAFVKSSPVAVMVQVNNGLFQQADGFSNRISINPLVGPVMGSNGNATLEPGEPQIGGVPGGKSIWYTWNASFTGVISLTTQGSDFDTLLGVYTGTNVAALTPVAADDDSGGFFTSLVTFNVVQGADYQITVDGFQGASGTVILGMPSPASYQVTTNSVPIILQQPTNQLAQPGATVTLSVVASNASTYQWSFNTAPISGATNSSLVLSNFQSASAGLYSVLAANGSGSVQSEPASAQIAVQNNGTPSSSQDKFGSAVDLSLAQSNAAPAIRRADGGDTRGYSVSQAFSTVNSTKEAEEPNHCGQAGGASQWYIYTTPTAGFFHCTTAGSTFNTILAVYTGPGTNFASLVEQGCGFTTNYQTQGQPDVLIGNVAAGTKLYIVVDGYLGASGTAHLSIGVGELPTLVSPPQSQSAGLGSPASFNVVANGSTNFSYQWQLNGVALPAATDSTFAIPSVQSNSTGSYSVVVSNVIGVVTSAPPAVLTLQFTPAINTQPVSLTAIAGTSATFSLAVAGLAPLDYQWRFDGHAIANATNSTLTLSPVTAAEAGSYSVVVSNSLGTVTSSNAVLTVPTGVAPPTVAITAPANNYSTTNPVLKVTGTASGKAAITQVSIEVGTGGFQPATGTTKWTATGVNLVPGTNLITVQCIDTNGELATATRSYVYTPTAQLTVLISPTNRVGETSSATGAVNNKWLLIGKPYAITAAPVAKANWLFENWTSGTSAGGLSFLSTNAKLSFVMATNLILQANFVTNPFTAVAGTYNGLFSPLSGITEQSSGFFTATIGSTSTGVYSANLSLDGGSYPFTGAFNLAGVSQALIKRAGKTNVTVVLNLDFGPGANLMTGTVSNNAANSWVSQLMADRAVFNAASQPATPYAGKFTMILPPDSNAPLLSPGGYGSATFTNNTAGKVILAGYLGDDTVINQSVSISQDGAVPVYVSLYTGKGSLQGWLTFTNVPPQTIFGALNWIKPPTAAKTLYPAGFTNSIEVLGSPYLPPATGKPVLNLANGVGTLTLADGNLAVQPLVFNVAISNAALVSVGGPGAPTNYLSVASTPATGVMTVTFRPTGARANSVAQGVVLQNQVSQPNPTNAAGWFKGTNQTGSFLLQ